MRKFFTLTALTVFVLATASAQTTWTTSKIDTYNGYDYELWSQDNKGTTTMKLTGDNGTGSGAVGGTFEASWSGTQNVLFRAGKKWGASTTTTVASVGNVTIDFAATWSSPDNVKMMGVYGWAYYPSGQSPTKQENGTSASFSDQIEYYIIQDRGSYNSATQGTNSKYYGEGTIDGIVYEYYVCDRINQPMLTGNGNFKQYFSVPKTSAGQRQSGMITVSKHFEEWERVGMKIQSCRLYEIAMKIESYSQSGASGTAKVTKNILTIGASIPSGNYTLTATASPAAGGTVTKTPNATSYAPGATVSVAAAAAAGWQFAGWEGDATGTTATVSVSMTKDKTVTAKFKPTADGTENLIKNGTFTDKQNWTVQGGTATWSVSGGKATVNITAVGDNAWSPQMVQQTVALEKGLKYRLSFDASAAAARTMQVLLQMAASPYDTYFGKNDVALTTATQHYEYEFEMTYASDANAQLAFNLGQSTQNVILSNVKLIYIADATSGGGGGGEQTGTISLKEAYKSYFKIGTAVSATEIGKTAAQELVKFHFNSITPENELKPDATLNQAQSQSKGNNVNPQVQLSNGARTILKWCSDNKIPLRGHCLVWHSQTPDWFFIENFASSGNYVSVDIMNQRMENYIKNIMALIKQDFPNLEIYAWDVVNEVFRDDGTLRLAGSNNTTSGTSLWMQIYKDNTFIYKAFEYARKYAPSGCKLYYNDYNEYQASKRDAIHTLVSDMYKKGICDGVGMQSHLSTTYPSVQLYTDAIKKFASGGYDIQITELDITIDLDANAAAQVAAQAKLYGDLFQVYKQYSANISAVVFWGTQDGMSWRKDKDPLIFDRDYQPKEAYNTIVKGMTVTPSGNYTLTATASPAAGGTVTKTPNAASYASGATVSVSAVAATGWKFTGWEGDATGTTATVSVSMNNDKTVTAKFAPTADGTENLIKNGTFTDKQNWTVQGGTATWSVSGGKATVNITAVGDNAWSPQMVQQTVALEKGLKYRLSFDASAAAARTMQVLLQMAASPYDTYFGKNDVALTTATQHYEFEFEMTYASDANAQLAFNLGQSTQNVILSNIKLIYIADFTPVQNFTLTAAASPTTGGTVTKTPNAASYASGATVSVSAVATVGWKFTGWTGDATGTTETISVSMNSNKTVTANFAPIESSKSDYAEGNRLIINNQSVFISGMNLAWESFGGDVGDKALDVTAFEAHVKSIRAAGGNAMRWWLHTDVQNCPRLNSDGSFNRLGTQTIANVKKALDIAQANGVVLSLCLFSFDMLQTEDWKANNTSYNINNNYKFLTVPANLDTYIENGLKPILAAVGSHPAVMCWEVFNEPEGMTSDKGGWSSQKIPFENVLRFTGKIAAEVHRSTTKMASTGIHEFGKIANYSDAKLKTAAGGDPLAYLDFYMAHYYPEYAGTSQSPFHNPASFWKADRPILIGEFPAQSWGPGTNHTNVQSGTAKNIVDAYNYAYDNGYCGLMSWSLTEGDKAKFGSLETTKPALQDLYSKHENDIKIKDVSSCSHTFSLWETTTPATCETAGVKTEKCSKCGALGTKTETIAKLPEHTYGAWSAWSVVTAATCETKGSEKRTRTCTLNANEIDTETREIPATGHAFSLWETTTPATCETAGVKTEKCSKCGALGTKTETIAKLPEHTYGAWSAWSVVTAATCETKGSEKRTRTCTLNANEIDTETREIPATGHDFSDWEITKAPTCGEAGSKTEKCAICGALGTVTEVIPATGEHTFVWIVNPENENEMIEVCSVCGEPSGAEPRAIACTHNFVWTVTAAATCETAGVETEVCSKCDAQGTTRPIAKLEEHDYGNWSAWSVVTAATCETKGSEKRTRTCTLNANEIDTETREIPATGHDFSDWEITKAPTCGEAGSKTEKCAICGALGTVTEVIPATGEHTFVWIVNPENENEMIEVCSICGEPSGAEPRAITCTHVFDEWKITTPATCSQEGVKTEQCSKCGVLGAKTEAIDKLPHTFTDWDITTPATCETAGVKTEKCSVCKALGTETETIAQLPEHDYGNWSDWNIVKPATCSENGSKERTRTCSLNAEEIDTETEVIPATGHTFVWIINPENKNEMIEVCSVCGEPSGAEPQPITCEHVFDEWKITTPATCSQFGEETRTCSLCGEVESKQIEKTAHQYEWKIDPTNPNQEIEVCSVCGEPSGAEPRAITCEHVFDEWKITTPATCETTGVKTEKCSKCGALGINTETIAKLPEHTYGAWSAWEIVKSATCETKGSEKRTRTCTLNANEIDTETREIPATGHTFTDWNITTPATCEAAGVKTEKCSVCKALGAKTETIAKLTEGCEQVCTHNFVWKVTSAATCETAGTETEFCSKCNAQGATRSTAKLGHNFGNYTSDNNATCTADGTETGACSRCGKTDTRTKIYSQLAHIFGNWKVTTAATCTEFGEETRTCSLCGKAESKQIAKTTHHYEWITDPTNPNQEIHACVDCGTPSGLAPRPKVCEHNFVWTVTTTPTCKTSGWEKEICSKCGIGGNIRTLAPLTVGCGQTVFYEVRVINGTCDNLKYAEGETVTIKANAAVGDRTFKQWSSSLHVTFANAYETTTTFVMPAQSILVMAEFETVGIETIDEETVKIYPNPAKDELKIENGELKIEKVEISDLTGRIILNSQFSILNSIDVSNFPQGVYIIKMYTNDSVIVRRFVKM